MSNVCADSPEVPPGTSTAKKDSTRSRSAVKSTGIPIVMLLDEFFWKQTTD